MRISSLLLRKLVTEIVSTQSSQILKIFFSLFILIGQRVGTTLKIILTKKHKVSRHVQSTKMLIKSTKMFVDIFNIHTYMQVQKYTCLFELLLCIAKWVFLHTYASSKKKLYTVRKLSPKLS